MSKCDETQILYIWQNSKTQNLTNHKNYKKYQTQNVKKTQKLKIWQHKNPKYDKPQTLKLWQNSKLEMLQNPFVKNNLTPQQPMRYTGGSHLQSRDVYH